MPYPDPDAGIAFTHPGYNPDCQVYQPLSAVVPIQTSTAEAGERWEEFCADFPFEALGDVTNYLTSILTAYCRLLFAGRSPVFGFLANTPRAGKDCLATLLQSTFDEYNELSLSGAGSAEDEKLVTGMLIQGKRFLHFANLSGRIRSTFLERISASNVYTSRVLGGPNIFSTPSDFILSLSGNSDFTPGGDLKTRILPVRLKLDVANPNARQFRRPDPAAWAVTNRFAIFGMLKRFTLDWNDAGRPAPTGAFSSFPGWWAGPAAIAAHALGTHPDIGSTSLQADSRVAGLTLLLDIISNPAHDERNRLNAPVPPPYAFLVSDLAALAADLQKRDPDFLPDFPLTAIEFNQLRSAQIRFANFVHAYAGVPVGPHSFSSPSPNPRPCRTLYRLNG
jgi:hypothetical protein